MTTKLGRGEIACKKLPFTWIELFRKFHPICMAGLKASILIICRFSPAFHALFSATIHETMSKRRVKRISK
jgi:hypothetical protein